MLSIKNRKIDLKKSAWILLTQSNQEHIKNVLPSNELVLSKRKF